MLGERLKRLRTGARMTQQELAERLGVSASAIGMYEQGRREPTFELLLRIGEMFGVSTDWLLARDEVEIEQSEPGDLNILLAAFQENLLRQDGLLFHGQPLSGADVEKVVAAMRLGAELAIQSRAKGDKRG